MKQGIGGSRLRIPAVGLMLAGIVMIASSSVARAAAGITLFDYPGATETVVTAVSGDGRTVAGTSYIGDARTPLAWRWSAGTGLIPMPTVPAGGSGPGGAATRINDISFDGSVLVGNAGATGFRWQADAANAAAAGSYTVLPDLPGGTVFARPNGVSADGSVIVGYSQTTPDIRAFRYVGGVMTMLAELPGGVTEGLADGVSADGLVVVGYGYETNSIQRTVMWDFRPGAGGADVAVKIPGLVGARNDSSSAISADGSTIVGVSEFESPYHHYAFRRTESDPVATNLAAPDLIDAEASAISGDGRIVIGARINPFGLNFHWTPEDGMRELQDVFTDAGIDLTGIVIGQSFAISDDGQTIGGQAYADGKILGYATVVPEPASALLLPAVAAAAALLARRPRGK